MDGLKDKVEKNLPEIKVKRILMGRKRKNTRILSRNIKQNKNQKQGTRSL